MPSVIASAMKNDPFNANAQGIRKAAADLNTENSALQPAFQTAQATAAGLHKTYDTLPADVSGAASARFGVVGATPEQATLRNALQPQVEAADAALSGYGTQFQGIAKRGQDIAATARANSALRGIPGAAPVAYAPTVAVTPAAADAGIRKPAAPAAPVSWADTVAKAGYSTLDAQGRTLPAGIVRNKAGAFGGTAASVAAAGGIDPQANFSGNLSQPTITSQDVQAPSIGGRGISGDLRGSEDERHAAMGDIDSAMFGLRGNLNSRGRRELYGQLVGQKSALIDKGYDRATSFEGMGVNEANQNANAQARLTADAQTGNVQRRQAAQIAGTEHEDKIAEIMANAANTGRAREIEYGKMQNDEANKAVELHNSMNKEANDQVAEKAKVYIAAGDKPDVALQKANIDIATAASAAGHGQMTDAGAAGVRAASNDLAAYTQHSVGGAFRDALAGNFHSPLSQDVIQPNTLDPNQVQDEGFHGTSALTHSDQNFSIRRPDGKKIIYTAPTPIVQGVLGMRRRPKPD